MKCGNFNPVETRRICMDWSIQYGSPESRACGAAWDNVRKHNVEAKYAFKRQGDANIRIQNRIAPYSMRSSNRLSVTRKPEYCPKSVNVSRSSTSSKHKTRAQLWYISSWQTYYRGTKLVLMCRAAGCFAPAWYYRLVHHNSGLFVCRHHGLISDSFVTQISKLTALE